VSLLFLGDDGASFTFMSHKMPGITRIKTSTSLEVSVQKGFKMNLEHTGSLCSIVSLSCSSICLSFCSLLKCSASQFSSLLFYILHSLPQPLPPKSFGDWLV
jgi:hypothetical protein